MTSGIRMPIVPHEVPVAKETAAEMTNTRAGRKWGDSEPLARPTT